jgi:cytochrome c oxidase assembly protein subunit 15
MEAGVEERRAGRRLRLPRVSPAAFRGFCVAALGAIVFVTITGATVRLTDSGLGCENWPSCGDQFLPPTRFHSLVEFSNRGVGIAVGITTLLAGLAAFRVRDLPRWLFWGALALPASVLAQGVLGGLTVLSGLHPLVVMGHFLLSLVAVAVAVLVVLGAHWFAVGRPTLAAPRWLMWLSLALVLPLLALVITGALVTAAGPRSGGENVQRFGDLEDAIYVHVRATAVFGIGFLVLLVALWRLRGSLRPELLVAGGLLAVLLVQMVVGEVQWRNELPWWLVLIHVTLATTAVACATLLTGRLVGRARRA